MIGHENDPTWQLDHGREPQEENEPITHRGAIIIPKDKDYYWQHPDYVDCEYTDPWVATGCGHASTIEEVKEEIDDYLNDMNQAR